MKKFLIKAALFILPFVLLSYGMDYLLSDILKKSESFADSEYPVWNRLFAGKINADVVIYGSSRAFRHVDPVMISDSLKTSAYNFGVNGHSFKTEYFRHFLLLKYNRKPKLIIQTLDVMTFEKASDLYNSDQFLPYMLNNKEIEEHEYNGFSSIDYKIPMIRYYGKKEAFLEAWKLLVEPKNNKPVRTNGFTGLDISWTNDFRQAQSKLGAMQIISDSSIVHLFERYIKECRQLNIPIVFVYTPEFIGGQKFITNRNDIFNIYHKLSSKYDIPFFDYSKDSISYHKEYFYNTGHLNKTGSEIFTAKLICDLRRAQITSVLNSPAR
jgi:hypothetical protein